MSLVIPCPSCKSRLKAPESLIGKTVKCPNCQAAIPVRDPGAPAPAPKPAPAKKPAPGPSNDFAFDDDQDDQPPPRKGGAVKKGRDEYTDDEPPRKPARGRRDDYEDEAPRKPAKGRRPSDEDFDDLERRVDDFPEDDEDRPKKGRGKKGSDRPMPRATEEDKSAAFNMYLFALIANLVAGGIGTFVFLIMWMMKRKESPLVDWHGKQFVNAMITNILVFTLVGIIGCGGAFGLGMLGGKDVGPILVMVSIGLASVLVMAYGVVNLINFFMGMFKAKSGEYYKYMMTLQLLK